MIEIPVGTEATLEVVVTDEMTVRFDELGAVHPVYATYTMAKHFEEAGRKLLLPHLEPGEDGLGRSVQVEHRAPSRVGERLTITARCVEVLDHRITCSCVAVDSTGRVVGEGRTVQVALHATVIARILGPDPADGFSPVQPVAVQEDQS